VSLTTELGGGRSTDAEPSLDELGGARYTNAGDKVPLPQPIVEEAATTTPICGS
jgi:hypothetical protein